jgi:trimeric autotransporter adhesin
MGKASESILALKPVNFRYKKQIDPEQTPQFGLLAEEVEKINPDLVARDDQGKPYTVRYEAINAMLLNEFLKAHRRIAELAAQMKQQAALIQEVNDKVELRGAASRTVANNQ